MPWRSDSGEFGGVFGQHRADKAGTGCCGSPMIALSMVRRLVRGQQSVSRANGERSLAHCRRPAAHGWGVIAILYCASTRGAAVAFETGLKQINHHRYGEVKTRLTIDGTDNLRGLPFISRYYPRA